MSDILDSLEKIIGLQIANQVKDTYHPYAVDWIQNYATKLNKVSDRPELKMVAYAIPGDTVNAFSMPGGFVYIYEGLINKFPKDQVCGVIGHEVAHIARKHCITMLAASYGVEFLSGLISKERTKELFNLVTTIVMRGYGRQYEFEADKYSVIYNHKANLYPFGMKHFMEWLTSVEERPTDKISDLLATHPPASERLKKINEEIERLGITEKIEVKPEIMKYLLPLGIGGAILVGSLAYSKRR